MLIEKIWSKQPGKWFCLATLKKAGRLKKEEKEKPKVTWFKRHQFPRIADKVEEFKSAKLNVYFCPHGFKERGSRRKDNAVPPHLLFADLDEKAPSACPVEPTWAIESSPGRYVGLWATDEAISEVDNQRWTYHVGADKTGWDFGQILRVPGTRNYKYDDAPRVKYIGGSGDTHKLERLRKAMPAEKTVDLASGDKRQKLYGKYEKKLRPAIRALLISDKTGGRERSDTLWSIVLALTEAGASRDDVFTIVWPTVWNKFKDRRDGDKELRRQLNKAVAGKMAAPKAAPIPKLFAKTMAEVEAEKLDWIWYPYMARGEVTIIEGDPGVGKSWLAQKVAAVLASGDGHTLPSSKIIKTKPLRVLFFDPENSAGTVMKPRLLANGCKRLELISQEESLFSMLEDDNVTAVRERLRELEPDLAIFDTLVRYLGDTDANSSVSVAQAMGRFTEIAREFNIPVVVLRHMNKGKEKALYRGQGSITFTGTARVCISVGWSDASPDERLFAINKINVAKFPKARAYTLTDIGNDMARLDFGEERGDLNADDIIQLPQMKETVGESADDWLQEFLEEEGKVDRADIIQDGDARGYAEQAIGAAAKRLGVISKTKGFGKKKRTYWSLPRKKKGA